MARMDLFIPHLFYTVAVRDFKVCADFPTAGAWAQKDGANGCTLYLPKRVKPSDVPLVAHELTHALKYICEDRHMDFTRESEHMAYLMQWMLGKILGYEYTAAH